MKIVLCSDNHTHSSVIKRILSENPMADYYWHLGDSECYDVNDLRPFISIMGNNDYDYSLPRFRIINIGKYSFLLIHGHGYTFGGYSSLVSIARQYNCNVVLFGHTHLKTDIEVEGIRLINPGSCFHNRDGQKPSYCLLEIDADENLDVRFKEICEY